MTTSVLQNIFSNPSFSQASLTKSINIIPNMYGRLNELDLMPSEGITTTTVLLEEFNGTLNLLPQNVRSGPATKNKIGKRGIRSLVVPHFSLEDTIRPDEIQNVREFDGAGQESAAKVILKKLTSMKNKHKITLEYMRCGALLGVVKDGDGTVITNLFTEFGITEKSVNFVFGTTTTDIRAKCFEVIRHIEDNLKGETMTRVHCLASPEWFDAFVSHPDVKDRFKYASSNAALQDDVRKSFSFAGITFEEYRGVADDTSGVAQKFIPANTARFFPVGTMDTFQTYFAPADFMETVNTVGQEMYAKQSLMKYDRGVELHTQMNPLPICRRPALLVKGTIS